MKAAVAIDDWKLPIFREHLDAAGFSYVEGPGLTDKTLILQVKYERVEKLQPVILAANTECARIKAASKKGTNH